MELQPKTEPGFGSNDHMNMENMSIHDLVSVLRTAYLTEQYDSVEEILVSRDKKHQTMIQDKFDMERQAVEDLKKREETCERCKRAESNYEKLLKEVKKTSLADRQTIVELKKKNNDLELEVSELRKLKEKWIDDSNVVDELRMRVGVLENEKNAFGVKNSELEKKNSDLELEVCELRKLKEKWVIDSKALAEVRIRVDVLEKEKNALAAGISKALADAGIAAFQEKETVELPMKRSKGDQGASSGTVYIEMGDQSKPTNLFASPPPIVWNTSTLLPSSKHHSAVWNDFRLNPNSKKTTICNYCSQKIKYYGTTSMAKHYKLCEKNPNWSIELEHASF